MRFIQAGEVAIADVDDFRVLHCLNKIMTRDTGYKASEGNDKLVLREEKDIRFFARVGITVVYPEDTFDDQSQVIADHILQVKEISLFYLAGFPESPAIGNVLFGQCRKICQVVPKYLMVVIHGCQTANLAILTVFVKRIAVMRK